MTDNGIFPGRDEQEMLRRLEKLGREVNALREMYTSAEREVVTLSELVKELADTLAGEIEGHSIVMNYQRGMALVNKARAAIA